MAAASSSTHPVVRIVEQCRVSSYCNGQPAALEGEVSLPLTFFDVFWLENHPVQRLFFYPWPGLTTAHFVASALPRLKLSLSRALRHYYPLAGTVRRLPGISSSTCSFHIVCTDNDSVPFTLAECVDGEYYFSQLTGDHARPVELFPPFVAEIPKAVDGEISSVMMALQATVLSGAGVCVGVSIGHLACDGAGFTSFLKTWAFLCRSEEDAAPPAGELPVIDRTLVSDSTGLSEVLHDYRELFTGAKWPSVDWPTVVRATFRLNRAHIEELNRRILDQRASPSPPLRRYSSFVLTCAYVWVCLLKAGEPPTRPPPPVGIGDTAYFIFAVDCRRRLRPPLPAAYLGNCLSGCFVDARRSDLQGEGGVGRAAEVIADSLAHFGHGEEILMGMRVLTPKVAACLRGRPLSVAGSPRFGVYGVDFGWGRPAKVEVVGIERTGSMALADSRAGDGGIEVGLALPATEMARFSSLFAAGLEVSATEGRI